MKISRKTILKIGAVGAILICVSAITLLLVLRSDWFRDQVRLRVIQQVEEASGGKVEISGFDYNWRQRTADLHGFTLHGTEGPSAAPLLRVDDVRVAVRIISILERSANVSSIVLTRPQVNVIVAPDGSTNLPAPHVRQKTDPMAELFKLKLDHFAIQNGLAVVDEQRIPLNVRADGVALTVQYRRAGPSYELALSSDQVDLRSAGLQRGPMRLKAQASLGRDRVIVEQAELVDEKARVHASGTLSDFAHPRADFQVDGWMPLDDAVTTLKVKGVRGGVLAIHGSGRYERNSGWSFLGKVDAKRTSYTYRSVNLTDINASADVNAKNDGLLLRRLTASAGGARFAGEASLKADNRLSLDGYLNDLTLKQAASFFTSKPLAWHGVASGRLRVTSTLNAKVTDLSAQGDFVIAPSTDGVPVSGEVQFNYSGRTNAVDFGQSHLNLPHTTVAFLGPLGQSQVVADSSNLEDLRPLIDLLNLRIRADAWPVLRANGLAHFNGSILSMMDSPRFDGELTASDFTVVGHDIDELQAQLSIGGNGIEATSFEARQGEMRVNAVGILGFDEWRVTADSPVRAAIAVRNINVAKLASEFSNVTLPIIQGIASGSFQLNGTLGHPEGRGHIASDSIDAYGERLNQVRFDADVTGNQLRITKGRIVSGAAVLGFSGDYVHPAESWTSGQARLRVDSNGFPLASLTPVQKYDPGLNAQAELHFEGAVRVTPGKFEPTGANGTVQLRNITKDKISYGNLTFRSVTRGTTLDGVISGDVRKNPVTGTVKVELSGDNQATAELSFAKVTVESVYPLLGRTSPPLFRGFMTGNLRLEGPLQKPGQVRLTLRSDQLQLSSNLTRTGDGGQSQPAISLHNNGPLVVEAVNGEATVRSFRIEGDQTSLAITGSVPYRDHTQMDLQVAGTVNLQAYHLFDSHMESSGISTLSANVTGSLTDPVVNGTLAIKDGSFFPENVPNGLSAVNGTVSFTRNRATLQKMTAKSGGGDLALGGFLSFGGGTPLVYHLEGSADNVRVRYQGSISITASAKLRLSGTSTSSLLSGTLTVSRVVFNPNTDVGNILAGFSAISGSPTNDNDFLTGLHMDVMIESAPNLQLSTSLSRDVEAEINLRLRGTPDHPIVLGSLSANQGDIQVFGTRYTINRGEIAFSNSVKIEPALDLDLETRARGVTVDITVSGTFSKLNIAYRSDPPLQPREIIALLAVGRAPTSADAAKNLRTNDSTALQSGANSLLGAAVTSPVTNRLSKLFGITNIRIDPFVTGLTNAPQTRVTLEQQISRDVTITYITNLAQTAEQIFRFEWAFSPQFSVVALRDDNGEFGLDFQYKKQFK